jgi:hypothetical protein
MPPRLYQAGSGWRGAALCPYTLALRTVSAPWRVRPEFLYCETQFPHECVVLIGGTGESSASAARHAA